MSDNSTFPAQTWIKVTAEHYHLLYNEPFYMKFERNNWYGYHNDRVLAAGTMAEVSRKVECHFLQGVLNER